MGGMKLPIFLRSYGSLILMGAIVVMLVTGYFTGIPWVSDNVDPFFHLTHTLYSAMWSNMWAPSVWTLTGFVVADLRSVRRHEQMKVHHNDNVGDLAAQIDSLTDRLVELMGGSTNDK